MSSFSLQNLWIYYDENMKCIDFFNYCFITICLCQCMPCVNKLSWLQVPVPLLKEKIATVTGILSEQQRLICRGRVLKDDELLSAYRILSLSLFLFYCIVRFSYDNAYTTAQNITIKHSTYYLISGN
jgi:hypothetical protein